jgi:hypothetical protein
MPCSLWHRLVMIDWLVIAPAAVILLGYSRQALIKSYGWGVLARYQPSELRSLLSRRERGMWWCGAGLLLLFFAIMLLLLAFPCRVAQG